jgi:predicted transcriptional regulator of viral defense system
MNTSFQLAQAIFQRHQGVLKAYQAARLGIDTQTIARMLAAGHLIKESMGLYRLASREPFDHPDLVVVALRAPAAVICLISALSFHQLTTQIPHSVYIALPRDRAKRPRIDYPPLEVVSMHPAAYSIGIENHRLDGVPVKIYSKEKTLADCFKYRRRIGPEVAVEALKMYFAEHKPKINDLLAYAKIDRVERIVRPYLQLFQ